MHQLIDHQDNVMVMKQINRLLIVGYSQVDQITGLIRNVVTLQIFRQTVQVPFLIGHVNIKISNLASKMKTDEKHESASFT